MSIRKQSDGKEGGKEVVMWEEEREERISNQKEEIREEKEVEEEVIESWI